ncbi:MAG: PTS transporter subunit EIIA [Gammaproteobacteria bacterium]|jgi:PTS system nitrogen regulatory IIA component|nr:PTS transporter subunit EIIA [Gammaproteobacteria bacterium]
MTLGHFQALSKQSLLSKKRVFERAAEAMGAALNLSSETIYRALLAREKLGSTAIGEGIAIPHCRINECSEAAGCLVTLQEPIDYGSADGQDVDIIFVLLVPEEATEAHLKLLAALARSFSNAEVRDRVRQTQDPEALKQLLLSGDAA